MQDAGKVMLTATNNGHKRHLPLSDIDQILPVLLKASGIDFSLYKFPTLKRAIQKRVHALRLKDTQEYISYLRRNSKEAEDLAKSILIRVTGFFRDPETFKVLKNKVVPSLINRKTDSIRIWVPGCCTGEEVYSLAMMLTEALKDRNIPVHIFGTDLNEEVLHKARSGVYDKKEVKGISRQYLSRYFKIVNGQYEISKNIRALCTFAKQNLIQDPPFSKLDLITCRNVLIYLKPEMQDKILKIFHFALNDHGFLMLGKSENSGILHPTLFKSVDKNHCIYSKRSTGAKQQFSFRYNTPDVKSIPTDIKAPVPYDFDMSREIDRILIERTGHAAVLVNEANDIVQTKGNVAAYFRLPSGRMSFNLVKMANDDLAVELKMLLSKVHKSSQLLCKRVETNQGLIEVEIVPLQRSLLREKFFLILMSPAKTEAQTPAVKPHKKILALQQELAATKAWMQSLIEEHENSIQELKSSHEEVMSSNEELQSLNEELQTAKEELESTNEEITTINEQLTHQIEAFRQSEERFRILVESVRDYAIFMLDPVGNVVTWNAGAERLKGYRADEIIGSHFSKFYPKEEQATKPAMELRITSRKGVYKEEGWRVRKDGSRFWARVVLTALRGKNGRLRGFAKVTYDMTEQKKTDELLRQSEERFRLIVESVQDYAIFMLDPKGNIVTWNKGAQRLKGYTHQEIIGKHISTFYTPEGRLEKRPQKLLAQAFKEGRVFDEGWRVRKDGSRFWANCTITALTDGHGDLRGFSKVTRDMTESKKKEDALLNAYQLLEERVKERTRDLQKYAEELMRSNADLQQFAYIASHDLQEPLRIVSVYVDLLKKQLKKANTDGEIMNYFGYLQEGALRAQRLIKELLEYSRIGSQGEAFSEVPIGHVIAHVLSLLDVAIKENNAVVTHDGLPTVHVDRFQMEQLFQNLISNAIKYRSKEDPKIGISAERKNGEWMFRVTDNGIGIEPQYKDQIFTVFKRLHSTQDYPGTGIGLALCKKIIERHNGRIWVESSLGKGATFVFTLPAQPKISAEPKGNR
jgi:two-component system CheB/CheR fusion protein